MSYGPAGDEKIVAQNIQANDLALTKSGAIYFVDTAQKTVGYIDAKGRAARRRTTRGEIMSPTALTLTPDQAMLLVARRHGSLSSGRFKSPPMDRSSTASRSSVWKCPKKDCSAASAA